MLRAAWQYLTLGFLKRITVVKLTSIRWWYFRLLQSMDKQFIDLALSRSGRAYHTKEYTQMPISNQNLV